MADPTNPGQPSDDASSRGTPVNVSEATIQGVTVTRMDVNKGHIKELQTDLLEELCKCIEEQTETLGGLLVKAKEEIAGAFEGSDRDRLREEREGRKKAAQQDGGTYNERVLTLLQTLVSQGAASGGGGGGDDGGGGGEDRGGRARARATGKEFDFLQKNLEDGNLAITKWHQFFVRGAGVQFNENIDRMNQAVFRAGSSLMDMSGGLRKVTELYELSQTGLIEVTALYEDLGSTLVQGRLSMQETVDVMKRMGDEGQRLVGTLGGSTEEVASTLFQLEENMRGAFGGQVMGRARREETAAVLTEILDQQRRAGVMASNEQIIQSRNTMEQLKTLDLIASYTGQTRDAILAQQKEQRKTLAELEAARVISKDQREALEKSLPLLERSIGKQGVDLLMKALEEGGVEAGIQRLMATDPAISRFMNQIGEDGVSNFEKWNKALGAASDNTLKLGEGADIARRSIASSAVESGALGENAAVLRKTFEAEIPFRTAALEARKEEIAIIEGTGKTLQQLEEERVKRENELGPKITGAVNDVLDGIKSNLGSTGALVIAVAANTIALGVNTAALIGRLGGGLGGGKGGRGKGGRPATAGRAAQTAAAQKLKGTSLERATLETKRQAAKRTGTGIGARIAGVAGKKLAGLGAGAAAAGTAAAPVVALGLTGYTAYELTDMIVNGSIEAITGGSIGTGLANLFGADATTDEQKAKIEAEIAEIKRRAAERRKGVAPTKGVSPQTTGDVAAVAPSEVVNPAAATSPEQNPMLSEMVRQNATLVLIHEILMDSNRSLHSIDSNTLKFDTIKSSGVGEGGKPSPPGAVKGKSGPPQPYTPLLSETTPEAVQGVYT